MMKKSVHHFIFILLLIFTSCDLDGQNNTRQSGAYGLYDAVDIEITGRTGDTIKPGDFFSDQTFTRKGGRGSGDENFGNFHVSLPVTINVTDSRDITLNIEDIFGDNIFTWQSQALDGNNTRPIGGKFEVDMPVLIRVSKSERILIDLEDIFGDNSFTWTVGKNNNAKKIFEVGEVGGPVKIVMSIKFEVVDSEEVEIDVEDVLCDNEFNWNGGERNPAAFVGGMLDMEVPLSFRIVRSENVRINLEDSAGDMTLDWIAGSSKGIGGPLRFDVPTEFIVEDSRDVNIDFEDQAGDNVLNYVLEVQDSSAPKLISSLIASTQTEFRVTNGSRNVKINSEDFFSDNLVVWKAPFAREARDGLNNTISVNASAVFDIDESHDINIDAEDVYGDNIFAWSPPTVDKASSLQESVHEVIGEVQREVNGEKVIIEFANLNQGNQYLWGPEPD